MRVWDADTGKELSCLRGHDLGITELAYSPDGKRLASRSTDGTMRVRDSGTGECLEVITGRGDATEIAAGPGVHPFRALAREGEIIIEDAATGLPVAWFPAALAHIKAHPAKS